MSWLRLGVALVFAGLYAGLIVKVLIGGAESLGELGGVLLTVSPVCTIAITYLLGVELDKAIRALRKGPPGE